ncbi:MAG: tetratricopeptide repeat protein [bacterium]|nr:tetratricopeptide repeat protein [bacterium]
MSDFISDDAPRRRGLLTVGLAALAFLVMSPALQNEFTNWDDIGILTDNYRVHYLSLDRVIDYFRLHPRYAPRPTLNLYIPLTLLSLACEHALWGLTPLPYFFTNVVLYSATTVLVYLFVAALTQRRGLACVVGVLFAVHPLHVESVAWLTERKDVLSGFFFVGALWAYVVGERRQWRWLYWVSFTLFVGAVLAKAVAVTLPAVLLLTDWYLYRRVSWRMIADKLRFFAVAFAAGLVTAYLQRAYGSIDPEVLADVAGNVAVALRGIAFYVTRGLAPVGLSAIYPRPEHPSLASAATIASGLLVAGLGVVIIVSAWRRVNLVAYGVLFFLITLSPCLQLIPTGELILAADRFFYLPSVGFLTVIASGVIWAWERAARWRAVVMAVVSVYCLALGLLTWQRTHVWRNSITLWEDTVRKYPHVSTALANLGVAYLDVDSDKAAYYLNRALAVNSNSPVTRYNLSILAWRRGATNETLASLQRLIEEAPLVGHQPYVFRANILESLGRYHEAVTNLEQSLLVEPLNVNARLSLARVYNRLGDVSNENAVLNETIAVIPNHPSAYMALANIFEERTNYAAASRVYERLVRALPGYAPGLFQHAVTLQRLGRLDEAREAYERLVKKVPWLGVAWSNLGAIHHLQGNGRKAEEYTLRGRALQPLVAEVQYNYACVQARAGRTEEALRALEIALGRRAKLREEAWKDPDFASLRGNARFQALVRGGAGAEPPAAGSGLEL